jgi:undecaprenyl diphosphate synthase
MSAPIPKVPNQDILPRHIAIIMDGNGRWAQKRGLPRQAGHRAGVKSARRLVEYMAEIGVDYVTLFAFSSENWQRPTDEVSALMALFAEVLKRETAELHKNGARLRFIGDRAGLGSRLARGIDQAEELTRQNTGLGVTIAMAYGGRWDIVRAAKQIAEEIERGELEPSSVTEAALEARLSTADLPDPDLLIRTGGEHRISNFLLWQSAYAELYFSETLWPDFSAEDVDAAVAFYKARQRRYGKTGDQLESQRC